MTVHNHSLGRKCGQPKIEILTWIPTSEVTPDWTSSGLFQLTFGFINNLALWAIIYVSRHHCGDPDEYGRIWNKHLDKWWQMEADDTRLSPDCQMSDFSESVSAAWYMDSSSSQSDHSLKANIPLWWPVLRSPNVSLLLYRVHASVSVQFLYCLLTLQIVIPIRPWIPLLGPILGASYNQGLSGNSV